MNARRPMRLTGLEVSLTHADDALDGTEFHGRYVWTPGAPCRCKGATITAPPDGAITSELLRDFPMGMQQALADAAIMRAVESR